MKALNFLKATLLVVVLTVGFISCSNDDDVKSSPLVGTWGRTQDRNGDKVQYVLVFNADNTGISKTYINGTLSSKDGVENFTYDYNEVNELVTLHWTDETYSFHIKMNLSENYFSWIDDIDGDGKTLRYDKI
jgi:hypothetical protein